MYKINLIDKICFVVCMIASINWGLIALFNVNIFSVLTNNYAIIQRIIYVGILLCSLKLIYLVYKIYLLSKK